MGYFTHICHLWHTFLPLEMGGVERYILTLSNYLSDQYPNTNFSLITDKTNFPLIKSQKIPKYERYSNLEVHRFGPNFLSLSRGAYFKVFHNSSGYLEKQLTLKLYAEMAGNPKIVQSDIFHVHGLWEPQYPTVGLRLSQHFKKPLIVSLHGDNVGTEFFYSMPLEKPEFASLLKHASAITTYSKTVLDALTKMGFQNKSFLIPNFVDTKNFKRPSLPDSYVRGKRAVMICRLDPFKDPLTAVQAFALVVKEEPKATLQIVGDGPLYEPIRALINELHLENSVFLMGKHDDVRPFLWSSDIFLTGNAFISVLEAWAAGLAVIAADEETTGKLIADGRNGVLVPPKKPEKLASAVLHVMRDNEFREELVGNGVKTAGFYDISCAGKKLRAIYEAALREPLLC